MRLIMFGTSSPSTIRDVDSPEALAASMKSRFLSDSACARRIRASNAQRTSARTTIIVPIPRSVTYPEMTTSSGMAGIVRKTLIRTFTMSSNEPADERGRDPERRGEAGGEHGGREAEQQ